MLAAKPKKAPNAWIDREPPMSSALQRYHPPLFSREDSIVASCTCCIMCTMHLTHDLPQSKANMCQGGHLDGLAEVHTHLRVSETRWSLTA